MSKRLDKVDFDWLTDQALLGLLVVILTIATGVILGEMQSRIGWSLVITSLMFPLISIALILILMRRPLLNSIRVGLEEIRKTIDGRQLTWLVDLEALRHYEETSTVTEIWLVSEDLQEDAVGGPFKSIVDLNIKRGVSYVYFVPSSAATRTRVRTIEVSQPVGGRLRTIWLPDSFFFLVPKLDIVIYNPLSVAGSRREAFMGIPVPGDSEHYHVAVTDDFIDRVVGTLLQHYRGAHEPSNTSTSPKHDS